MLYLMNPELTEFDVLITTLLKPISIQNKLRWAFSAGNILVKHNIYSCK